jgi:uncharacterized protein
VKTPYYSYATGRLPKGCRLCVQGRKSVLFVTGICATRCYFCPISDKKYQKDVVYINEWPTNRRKNMITEIEMCSSKGVGITGGDPLSRLSRTLSFIKSLKKHFGPDFHIHLYTPLTLVTKKALARLAAAGLDEIRFHPSLEKPDEWDRLKLADLRWKVGVEIPVIPGKEKETKGLIDFIRDHVDFLNLNELEMSDTNANQLHRRGFRTKGGLSYAIKGSHELGQRLFRYAKNHGIPTHYCTARLKDAIQLRRRIKLRSKKAKRGYDIVTVEGMLIRGALYGGGNIRKVLARLQMRFSVPMTADYPRRRILAPAGFVRKYAVELRRYGLKPAIVEEYPTYDCLNVITDFL